MVFLALNIKKNPCWHENGFFFNYDGTKHFDSWQTLFHYNTDLIEAYPALLRSLAQPLGHMLL